MNAKFYWLATFAWAATIFYQSILKTPTLAAGIAQGSNIIMILEHVSAYAVLCILLYFAMSNSNLKNSNLHAFMLAIIYGAAIEFLQGFVGRTSSIFDEFINSIGAFVSAAIVEVKSKKWTLKKF